MQHMHYSFKRPSRHVLGYVCIHSLFWIICNLFPHKEITLWKLLKSHLLLLPQWKIPLLHVHCNINSHGTFLYKYDTLNVCDKDAIQQTNKQLLYNIHTVLELTSAWRWSVFAESGHEQVLCHPSQANPCEL